MSSPNFFHIRQLFPIDFINRLVKRSARTSRGASFQRVFNRVNHCYYRRSCGIDRISEVLRCLVEELADLGAKPFIIPAMGSHGGGTAEG